MKYLREFQDSRITKSLRDKIFRVSGDLPFAVRIMEVCGTHTMNIGKHGLREIIPDNVSLISGPGCPVCVTGEKYIDSAVNLAEREDVIIATFGDMLKVPGAGGRSLKEYPSGKVLTVYSPMDALKAAVENPSRKVVFLGVGFETTAPLAGRVVQAAKEEGLVNFFCFSAHKLIPPALKVLAEDEESDINGFLLPGHVSSVIGVRGYDDLNIAGAVAGFEPADILMGILEILKQIRVREKKVKNCYRRAVSSEGNSFMKAVIKDVFEVVPVLWRGLGKIPSSGLKIGKKYEKYDAQKMLNIPDVDSPGETKNNCCLCGEVLKGKIRPDECSLFDSVCTLENPSGPCMVSSEGACSAYYRYER